MLPVSVGVVGPGLIGGALISQIAKQADKLKELLHASINVIGVANSKKMLVQGGGIDVANFKQQLETQGEPADLAKFADLVKAQGSGCYVLIDCTASDSAPSLYVDWVRKGFHVITPNKKFGAGPLARWQELQALCRQTRRCFMYEATVGAGLPILSTFRDLLQTGDQVVKVEGILSGTLSYIFNTYKVGMKFSDVVADAKAKGYTEPDPRDDLSGTDVARKVIILAREAGLPVELSGLRVDSLVPGPLAGLASPQDFMDQLPQYDTEMAQRAEAAAARGEVIRYVGLVDVAAGECSVTLKSYPADHPFAQLRGSDNMISFTTERYRDRPLIVRGPGAGAEVTAAGVFSDLLHVVRSHHV